MTNIIGKEQIRDQRERGNFKKSFMVGVIYALGCWGSCRIWGLQRNLRLWNKTWRKLPALWEANRPTYEIGVILINQIASCHNNVKGLPPNIGVCLQYRMYQIAQLQRLDSLLCRVFGKMVCTFIGRGLTHIFLRNREKTNNLAVGELRKHLGCIYAMPFLLQ